MRVANLGDLEGPVLLFGGPYSNAHALQALIEAAGSLGIGARNMICTGDVVAYCGQPRETVARMRDLGCVVVAGNCEKQLAEGAADCGCGFEEGSTCDLLSIGWYGFANGVMGDADRRWMARCPDLAVFTHRGKRYGVLHGGVTDIARMLWPVSSEESFAEEIASFEAVAGPVDALIAGHCGLTFSRRIGDHDWINAGVIGMPENDGWPETRFAVLDEGIRFENLAYDAGAAREAMEQAGMMQGYHEALTSGYWPSEDVLPSELRARG